MSDVTPPCDVGFQPDGLAWLPPTNALPAYPASLYDIPAPSSYLDALARAADRVGALQAEVRELRETVAKLIARVDGVDIASDPGETFMNLIRKGVA